MSQADYAAFIERKTQLADGDGFEPLYMPSGLFDFQAAMVEWALRKGKGALFEDCGLGKTFQELAWAENVVRKTNRPVLILTPLAVASQTMREGTKFGIEVKRAMPGQCSAPGVYVTNYERLHHLESAEFGGVVCDESSILKHFSGATQRAVTRFMLKTQYRLLGTATAAPNDYIELGTSSEALGYLGYTEMLARFFKQTEDAKPSRIEDVKHTRTDGGNYFQKLSFRVTQTIGQYRLKHAAVVPFWRWVASWARACRKPSDLGFDDALFILPELIEREHIVEPTRPADGMLFTVPAFGLQEERDERRRTLDERCELVARLVDHDRPALVWCHMNAEGDLLEQLIPGALQVAGSDDDDVKEERLEAFASGQARVLITKAKIAGLGMNFQHCNHVVTFASHSFEQYYQSIRRCWRFGQKRPVTVDVISTTGEVHVRDNMQRKARQAEEMFAQLVEHMQSAQRIERTNTETKRLERPAWLG
jgi:superfamily II DNA or RNA helicase